MLASSISDIGEENLSENRDDELRKVQRFITHKMFYRQNLEMHIFCVQAIAKKVFSDLKDNNVDLEVSLEDLLNFLEVHDDVEIITGDMGSHLKIAMSDEEKKRWNRLERLVMIPLTMKYGRDFDFNYFDNLEMAQDKKCLISQLGSYIDKLAGFGLETIHEILSGNYYITRDNVHSRYLQIFQNLPENLPLLDSFLSRDDLKFNFTYNETLEFLSKDITTLKRLKQIEDPKKTLEKKGRFLGIPIYNYCIEALLDEDENRAYQILTERRESEHLSSLNFN